MPWHSGRSRPCGSLPPSGGRRVKPSRCISVMSDLAPIDRLPRSSWRRTVWRNTLKRGWPTGDADVHDGCEGRELKQERKADLSRRTHPCNSSMKYLPVKTNFRADRAFPYTPRLNLTINLGANASSLYLGEPVVYHQSTGPTLAITADGDDINFAQADSGSGGLVAGAAASANTNTGGGASASIADNSATGTNIDVSSLTITAQHTAQFDSQTNTLQADAVGFSGSWANNNDNSTVKAHIGNFARIVTQNLQVLATNTTDKNLVPSGQNNVS